MTYENINPLVKNAEYAVRGELAIRAEQLRNELNKKSSTLPFKQITNCNIGNPQQLNQQPITYLRQVSALLELPALLDPKNKAAVLELFPADAVRRAEKLSNQIGSIGAYSHSQGIPAIRENVARFIEERDGFSANPNDIFLTAGASQGVQMTLQTIIEHSNVGIMIPIPQYPLYTASIGLYNGKDVHYYLNEKNDWGLDLQNVRASLHNARNSGTDVRALCIINPGNPTGNVLTKSNMEEIIDFCFSERLVLLADEVYQTNVYYPETRPWYSFKHVLKSMGSKYSTFELVSFHSISKGMIGECGRRGGYFECSGIDPKVQDELYKLASIGLCPNVQGQVAVDVMVNPPKPGDESFELYNHEMNTIYESLKRRALRLSEFFNSLEGVTCNPAQGSMYLFPRIRLPKKAVDAAAKAKKQPDTFYTLKMLEATGVCVVPGSGFLQEPQTYHFRSTFLPPENQMDEFIGNIQKFHSEFMEQYRY
ncbi:pyridoxal phosphate-dependent transferase [Paraphysoderma sedebokerense]|nr:pyridoxal phosphate-dependent transferase [Paraphysoderma sedebokerense]